MPAIKDTAANHHLEAAAHHFAAAHHHHQVVDRLEEGDHEEAKKHASRAEEHGKLAHEAMQAARQHK
jgi:hypothetical protein